VHWARSQGGARARGGGEIEIQFTKFERAEPGKMEMKPSRRFGARAGKRESETEKLLTSPWRAWVREGRGVEKPIRNTLKID
jgi:hypothetical protein